MGKKIRLPHPGEFLKKEWLMPLKISQYKLAKDLNVPAMRISEIVRGKRGITPDTAIRLGKYFNVSAEYWLNLQAYYNLMIVKEKKNNVEKEVTMLEKRKLNRKSHKAKFALHR